MQAQLVVLAQRVLIGKGGAAFVAFGFEVTHVRAEPGTRPGQGTVAGRLGRGGGQHENTGWYRQLRVTSSWVLPGSAADCVKRYEMVRV